MNERRRHRTTRSPWGFVAIGVGVVLAVGVPVAWSTFGSSDVPADLGAGTAVELARDPGGSAPGAITSGSTTITRSATPRPGSYPPAEAPTVPRTPASSTGTTPPGTASAPAASTAPRSTATTTPRTTTPRSTRSAPTSATASSNGVPNRLTIDDLSVDAPVIPVGVDDGGDLAIPEDVDTVGWYRFGPEPGESAGSVVLSGHVDSRTQGVGQLRALWSATPGMLVRVDLTDGRPLTYRVVSREIFVKGRVPLDSLFSTSGAPRLTLITCGGPFDEATRSYQDNVVVTAVPA